MDKKVLPITKPIIRGYSHQAALLSIMMSYEQCKPWICNNYIQIFTLHNLKNVASRLGTLDFYYMDYADFNRVEYKANPWIRYSEIPLILIENKETSILSMLVNLLDADLYITVDIDKYYIPQYGQNDHIDHTILIYGYEFTKRIFYCYDNFKDGKFLSLEIDFSDIIKATNSRLKTFKIENQIMTPCNPGPIFTTIGVANMHQGCNCIELEKIDLKRILYFLNSYIEPESFYMTKSNNNYYTYGIYSYNEIVDYFESSFNQNNKIDTRAYYSLMDHKSLMIWRLNYIQNMFEINLLYYIERYKKLEYNIKGRISDASNLLLSINRCRDDEKEIVKELINYLKLFVI